MTTTAEIPVLQDRIRKLKQERNAVILAHIYQRPEVQDVADYVGDSLGLARQAAATDADVIVFCGVHFMAESAAILSPDKTVLLPDAGAGCPMADMVTPWALREKKKEHPEAVVVCYVNSSAEVKAESDIVCTSANAVKVVNSIPAGREIIFVPDKNLARYVAGQTGRNIIPWPGYCVTHDRLKAADILAAKKKHPQALVMVHPECAPEVQELADAIYSTTGMVKFAKESTAQEFIVGTEEGILHQLHRECPGKTFYLASQRLVCPNMKKTTLEKVVAALENMEPEITVPDGIRERAISALERMLNL